MLTFFRTNQLVFNFLLFIYALLLRGSAFFVSSSKLEVETGILTNRIYSWFPSDSLSSLVASSLLVVFHAIVINILVSEYRLDKDISLFPGVFYVMLTSCFSEFLYLSPILIANTFYSLLLFSLFEAYKKNYTIETSIFNLGFLVAMTSLCFPAYIYLFFFGIVSLSILKSVSINDLLSTFLGFLSPYVLVGTYCFLFDEFDVFWQVQFSDWIGFLSLDEGITTTMYWKVLAFLVVILVALGGYGAYVRKKDIQKQKYINIIYLSFIFAVLGISLQKGLHLEYLLIFTVPLAILVGFFFSLLRSTVAEAVHFLMLVVILVTQFSQWFF